MDADDGDEDDLDQLFRTFQNEPESGEESGAPVPAPRAPVPNDRDSAIAFPEPGDDGD